MTATAPSPSRRRMAGNWVAKRSPASDFYVLWSERLHMPVEHGPRDRMAVHLRRLCGDTAAEAEARLARADRYGTSALVNRLDTAEPWGSWEDFGPFRLASPDGTRQYLTRTGLFEFVDLPAGAEVGHLLTTDTDEGFPDTP